MTLPARSNKLTGPEPIRFGCYTLGANGLEVTGRPTRAAHLGVADFVNRCVKFGGWWLVDLITYADTRDDWREDDEHGLDGLDINPGTRKQYRHLGKVFPRSARVDGVPMGHHAVVAAVPEPQRRRLLERARDGEWNQGELRHATRKLQRTTVIEGRAPTMHTVEVIVAIEIEAETTYEAEDKARALMKTAVQGVPHAKVILSTARPS